MEPRPKSNHFGICMRYLVQAVIVVGVISTGASQGLARSNWKRPPLPEGIEEFTDFAQTSQGELFLATEAQLFIRSPFGGENGWERVAALDTEFEAADADRIIGVEACQGIAGTALLVVTNDRLFAVTWQYRGESAKGWGRFRYVFELSQVPSSSDRPLASFSQVFSMHDSSEAEQHATRGFVATTSNELVPVVAQNGRLQLGVPVELAVPNVGTRTPTWSRGRFGWGYAWLYATARIWTFNPDGELDGTALDIADLMAPAEQFESNVRIHCLWLDSERDLLFAGTNYGLAVTAVEQGTGHITGEFEKIESIGLASVRFIGSTAGRMWVVTGQPDLLPDLESPLVMERPVGKPCQTPDECRKMQFFVPAEDSGPIDVSGVVHAEDDRVLIEAEAGTYWEWVPGKWRKLPESPVFRGFSVGEPGGHRHFPCVIASLLQESLVYLAPSDDSYWQTHSMPRSPDYTQFLVPDQSANGVWGIEDGMSVAGQFGSIAFHTPNGSLASGLSVAGGLGRLHVRSVSIDLPNGEAVWPLSRHGGLILPSGENLVHGESGFQQLLDWSLESGVRLEQMLPGGESSESAWLAIQHQDGHDDRVVRVGLPEQLDVGEAPRLDVSPTELTCDPQLKSVLLSDSDGYVWFAHQVSGSDERTAWIGQKVDLLFDYASDTRELGKLPQDETPRFLWLAPDQGLLSDDHLLFTERGVVIIPRNELPFEQPDGPRLLVPEQEPTGAWQRLFAEDAEQLRFDSVIHSNVLLTPQAPRDRAVLLTKRLGEGRISERPGPAFSFAVDSPSTTLEPVLETRLQMPADHSVGNWWPESLLTPELLVVDREDAQAPAPEFLVLRRTQGGLIHHFRSPLTELDRVVDAVTIDEPASADGATVDFGVTDGWRIAMHRFPPTESWSEPMYVFPREVVVHDTETGPRTYRVTESPIPDQLPHTVSSVEVELASAYGNWWYQGYGDWRLHPTEDAENAVKFSPQGMARLPINPGRSYALTIEHTDPGTGAWTELFPLRFEVSPKPPPVNPFKYVAATLGGLVLVVVGSIGLNAVWRRTVVAWIRQKYWHIVAADCDLEGNLVRSEDRLGIEAHRPWSPKNQFQADFTPQEAGRWPSQFHTALNSEQEQQDFVATALIEADQDLLRRTPLKSLDEELPRPLVTGFIPTTYRVTGRPDPKRTLQVAVASSAEEAVADHKAIRKIAQKRGFKVRRSPRNAPWLQVFCDAMRDSDIVIMEDTAELLQSECRKVSEALDRPGVRCRMIVLGIANDTESARQLALTLAAAGIHVLQVSVPDESRRFILFVESLMDAFLPHGGRAGISLAEAVFIGLSNQADNGQDTNSKPIGGGISLFGDPSARIAATPIYDAFLSHSHKDRGTAEWLQRFLEKRWGLWSRRLRICRDVESFGPRELGKTVPEMVAASRRLIVCCSADAADSQWVDREVKFFLRDHSPDELFLCEVGDEADEQNRQTMLRFVDMIEQRAGRHGLLRPNLRGRPERNHDCEQRAMREACTFLADIADFPKDKVQKRILG